MEKVLKKEFTTFFWKRLAINAVLGLVIMTIFFSSNNKVPQIFGTVSNYIISALLIKAMLNNNNSKMVLIENKQRVQTDFVEILKIYWSFFWREFLFALGIGLLSMIPLMIGVFLVSSGSHISLIIVLLILTIVGTLVASYYIGRYVFMEVIEKVTWKGKNITTKKELELKNKRRADKEVFLETI